MVYPLLRILTVSLVGSRPAIVGGERNGKFNGQFLPLSHSTHGVKIPDSDHLTLRRASRSESFDRA